MKNMFVRLRPESDGHCKLTYSVNPLHCVGATRYQDAPLKGKVHIASIEINMKKRGYTKMFLSPGMLVKVKGGDPDLDYIVQEILCYVKEPHR